MSKLMKLFKIGIFGQKLDRIISATSDWNLMNYGLLNSSHQGASSSIPISLLSINEKLFAKIFKL